jgi:hypothetical protein
VWRILIYGVGGLFALVAGLVFVIWSLSTLDELWDRRKRRRETKKFREAMGRAPSAIEESLIRLYEDEPQTTRFFAYAVAKNGVDLSRRRKEGEARPPDSH